MEELSTADLQLLYKAIGTAPTELDEMDEIIMAMATSLLLIDKTELATRLLQQHREEQQQ